VIISLNIKLLLASTTTVRCDGLIASRNALTLPLGFAYERENLKWSINQQHNKARRDRLSGTG